MLYPFSFLFQFTAIFPDTPETEKKNPKSAFIKYFPLSQAAAPAVMEYKAPKRRLSPEWEQSPFAQ